MDFLAKLGLGVEITTDLEYFLRIIIAALCGIGVGIERTRRMKEAGLRTHIIVSCTAALVMILSKYGFTDCGPDGELVGGLRGADPARIAAQIVSGVTFLGAGVIFRNGNSIKGLTTAAGIWATSAIGMTIGAGKYTLGILFTVFVIVVQFIMGLIAFGADAPITSNLCFTAPNTDEFKDALENYLKQHKAHVMESNISIDKDSVHYNLTVRANSEFTIEDLHSFLMSNHIESISCETLN